MNTQLRKEISLVSARQAPLAVALIGALGLGFATTSIAALVPVTSCLDDGSSTTLRHAVLIANAGDTVDMSGLLCSTITLLGGQIHIDVDPLTIQGPGAAALTIDGNNADRIFYHSTNTLTLSGLTLAHGKTTGANAYGGCVYSKGSVALKHSTVTGCTGVATGIAYGGGVFAKNIVSLYSSSITNNVANATGPATIIGAAGGGVLAQLQQLYMSDSVLSGNTSEAPNGKGRAGGGGSSVGEINVHYSTITGNKTVGKEAGGFYGVGGGLYGANQNYAYIGHSTIDHNQADSGGGLYLKGSGNAVIADSTISSNTALGAAGVAVAISLRLLNSTIAFNTAGTAGAAGLFVAGSAELDNSILADNSPSGTAGGADFAPAPGATITGDHNVIKVSSGPVPPHTITLDPILGPLACNGGSTRTHALLLGSPAIDAGVLIAGITHDQRGREFARDVGAEPDLGAYERNPDQIFAESFDCI